MSTPNDNKSVYEWDKDIDSIVCKECGETATPLRGGKRYECYGCGKIIRAAKASATQPSPAAVEQALAEEKANQEKIGATVQAARAGAILPIQIDWQAIAQEATDLYYATRKQRDTLLEERNTAIEERNELRELMSLKYYETKQERDALQAQRDELLVACKNLLWHFTASREGAVTVRTDEVEALALAAIARATEGGKANES